MTNPAPPPLLPTNHFELIARESRGGDWHVVRISTGEPGIVLTRRGTDADVAFAGQIVAVVYADLAIVEG